MPDRARRICPHCQLVVTGRCECRREAQHRYDQERGKDRQFYSTKRWRTFRKRFLRANPWCVFCREADRYVLATVVDHIQPRKERADLAYEAGNCRGLCVSCHNRRTRKQEQGARDG